MAGTIRLLYVITKLECGGAQKQLLALIRGLDGSAYQPFLFTCRSGPLMRDAESIPGLTVVRSRFLDRPLDPWRDIRALIELVRCIRRNRIDLIHTHSSKAGIIGRLAARWCRVGAVVHTVHGWSFHDFQPALYAFAATMLERCAARWAGALIVVSEADRLRGLRASVGFPEQYVKISYGIRAQDFVRTDLAIRQELGIPAQDQVVGTIACFKPQKAPLDFIRMAASVVRDQPHTTFVMIGDGTLRVKIERAIRDAGLQDKIILAGWRSDVARLLCCMDVFVLTSLWEGLPIAVLEAMAAGVAVVATDTGGIRDVITPGRTGLLCPCRDAEALAGRVRFLLREPDARAAIAQEGRRSLDHPVEAMVARTQALYKRLGC